MLILLCAAGCTHLEPRWLLQALPGRYPDVVYYFPTKEPLIALTIDDGPDPDATSDILRLLAQHRAQATFFFLTDNIPGHEQLVWQTVREGHELGNHLTEDEVSARLDRADFAAKLSRSAKVLSVYGTVRWFRPGSAWYNEAMLDSLRHYGYRIAEASMPPLDARIPSPALVAGYIKATVKPGSIIVLHTNRNRGRRTLETLRKILPAMTRRGYRLVSLSTLAASADEPVPRPARLTAH
jgi:peptidoglycan/xylan/chitin deacetylase (PgdA/CDA1 family)